MKFNWRANWEILLVLVIIVIGIVITTIAAIRNKAAETEEADFGQLFPPSTGNAFDGGQTPPASDQLATSGGSPDGPDYRKQQLAATRKAAATLPAVAATRLAKATAASARAQLPTPATNDKHDDGGISGGSIVSAPASVGALEQAYQSPPTTGASRDELYEPTTELPAGGSPKHLTASNKRHVSPSSQSASNIHPQSHHHHHHHNHHHIKQQQQQTDLSEPQDDIHTTRSSLSGNQKGTEQLPAALNNSAIQYQQQQPDDRAPLPAFHGPYGGSFQADSTPLVDSQLAAADGAGTEPQQTRPTAAGYPPRIATANETTYNSTRLHSSDQMLMMMNQQQQQQLANLIMQQQQQQEQEQNSGMIPANQYQQQQQQRGSYTGSLPISLLLGDLLKLTQPNFGLSSSTSADESIAGGRSSHSRGILQQIRSLPGPLLSLLTGGQQQQQATGNGGVGQPTSANHEASESHQNVDYRISMSPADIHSIFARSLSRSTDMLPAYPPPKGVLQPWVSPTSGGNPNHTEAQSSNTAEFVAGNTAGFVRAFQQQPPMSADLGPQQYPAGGMDSTFAGSGQQQQQEGDTISISQLQQQQQQQQQQQENYVHAVSSGNNNYQQQFGPGQAQDRLSNPMTQRSHLYTNQAGQQPQFIQQQQQVAATYNQAPVYVNNNNNKKHPHRSSEVAVPLGYSPPAQLQLQASQHQQQQPRMLPGDFGSLGGLESAPKPSVVASSIFEQQQQQQAAPATFNRQPIVLGSIANQQRQAASGAANMSGSKPDKRRRKRSASSREQQREREFEAYASKYRDDDDDWDDSYPLSVVSPDGRPMSNERFRGLSAAASNPPPAHRHHPHRLNQIRGGGGGGGVNEDNEEDGQMAAHPSQRAASHVDHHRHHHHHHRDSRDHVESSSSLSGGSSAERESRDGVANNKRGNNKVGKKSFQPKQNVHTKNHKNEPRRHENRAKKHRQQSHLEAAGSDLMSKLLGTASTNDESEMDVDLDGDDDDANERRKEELEDAEFGILNDSRSQADSAGGGGANDISQVDDEGSRSSANQLDRPGGGEDVSRTSSASAGETTYSQRRNHQQQQQQQQPVRSDIEFYGHPGEETRQLKYGILGSGNYEVVNGGIYPEVEESSAAAVNSVANYVRKPGGLLASLPKMLQGGESMGHQHHQTISAAFMPGGRIGGFLRGSASSSQAAAPNGATEQEVADLAAALMGGSQRALDKGDGAELTMPLLDLIDAGHQAAGYQLDGHQLISQLGSSARSTHTSKDLDDINNEASDSSGSSRSRMNAKERSGRQKNRPINKQDEGDDSGSSAEQQQRQQSSISGSHRLIGAGSGANQFNRYQILPSKKVTIFSDQDLDSAPSDLAVRASLPWLS